MVYLEYDLATKQVVEIHESKPQIKEGYGVAKSNDFQIGDEFKNTIWVNEVSIDEVDNEPFVSSYAAIKNNPIASRLLRENKELKELLADLTEFVLFGGVE